MLKRGSKSEKLRKRIPGEYEKPMLRKHPRQRRIFGVAGQVKTS